MADRSQGTGWRQVKSISWRSAITASVAIAVIVNLVVLVAWAWSRDGQTTSVYFEASGDEFRVRVNDRDYLRAQFPDAAAEGQLILQLEPTDPITSLPTPRGIDYVRVFDRDSGELLFEDEFEGDTLASHWTPQDPVTTGVEDGHLVQTVSLGTITLRDSSFSDVLVEAKYDNVTAMAIMLRADGARDGVRFEMRPFRHYDSRLQSVHDGVPSGAVGQRAEMPREGVVKSIVSMALSFYPWVLLLLGVGIVIVAVLQFIPLAGVLEKASQRLASLGIANWITLGLVLSLAIFAFATTEFLLYDYGANIVHVPDEVAYRFQARLLASGRFHADAPPVGDAFTYFFPSLLLEEGGKWYSVYPFGHPLVLALGERFGVMHVIPPLVGALTVVGVFLAGRIIHNTRTGLLAAAMLALSPFFLMTASNFMSHNTASLFVCGTILFLALRDRRPLLFPLLAGVSFGLLFNTRPLSAFGLMPAYAGMLLWLLWAGRKQWRRELRMDAAFAAGALLMLVAYGVYNWGTTGNPFEGQYQASATTSEVIGFGGKHSASLGIQNEQVQVAMLVMVVNNWPGWLGLGFILMPFLLGTRKAWDWFMLGAAVSIMAVYTLYEAPGIMHGPRYWYEAMPFLVLLAARGADRAAEVLAAAAGRVRQWITGDAGRPLWAGVVVVYGFVLFFVVAGSYQWLFGGGADWNVDLMPRKASDLKGFNGANDLLLKRIDEVDPHDALVMIETCSSWQCYGIQFDRNSPDLDGDVVYVKSIPERNPAVFDLYPDRLVFFARYPDATVAPFGATPGTKEAQDFDNAPLARTVPDPTPAPTATPDVAAIAQRDADRRTDLEQLAGALRAYAADRGSLPNSPEVTSFCSYSWDVGCAVKEVLDPLPSDPVPGRFYWYQSDGSTYFYIFAAMEGGAGGGECPDPIPQHLAAINNLYCVRGQP